ncbi:MAG TPA: hypothetical protein VFZ40_01740, partial [Pyrinomonadaceae bacterium]
MTRILALIGVYLAFQFGLSITTNAQVPKPELVVQTGHTGDVNSLKFSPDGRTLVSEGDKTIKLWDAGNGHELRTLVGHQFLNFSVDGKTFTTVTGKKITVWDTTSGKELRTVTMSFAVSFPFAFTQDGKTVATLALSIDSVRKQPEYMIKLGDAVTGQELRSFPISRGSLIGMAFSPNGRTLAYESLEKTITLLDAISGQVLHTFEAFPSIPSAFLFNHDGSVIAST